MTGMPDITVECAFSTSPDATAPEWVDLSTYVEADSPIEISRGREDELSEIQPSRLKLILDNSDGRFTPGNASSTYYPNVKKNRRIRVNARWPLGQAGNFLTANQASFETSVAAWSPGGSVPPTLTQSASNPFDGTKSMLITWGTGGTDPQAATTYTGLVAGRVYTVSAYVFVPSGTSPFVKLAIGGIASGTANNTRGVQQRISYTFTATQTTHTIQVIPASSPTSGDTVFVDAVQLDEGSSVVTFTTATPPIYRRFTGYVDEWPVTWPGGTSEYATVAITASSRRAQLSVGSELRSIIEEVYLLDSPNAYYPMGDPGASPGKAADVSGNQKPQLTATGTGSVIQWRQDTGPGTDGLLSPHFQGGRFLTMTVDDQLVNTTDLAMTVECFFNTSTDYTATAGGFLAGVFRGSTYANLEISPANKLRAIGGVQLSSTDFTLTSTPTVNDGLTHHAAFTLTYSGGNITPKLYLDGTLIVTGSSFAAPYIKDYRRLNVGAFSSPFTTQSEEFTGTISHVAVTSGATAISDAHITDHANSGLTGFSGETSSQRIIRLAGLAGITNVTATDSVSTSMLNQEVTGQTVLQAMDDVAATESGVLFDGRDGTLIFKGRAARYNAASALTIDAALQELDAAVEARLDGQQLINDVTAKKPDGTQVRAINADSIVAYGVQRKELNLWTTLDAELSDAANWNVNRYNEPGVRVHQVAVDVLNAPDSLIAALLNADIGTRLTLSNLPPQAPAATMDGFVEGTVESIGMNYYTLGYDLSPVGQSNVWQLDSSVYSVLDTSTILAY